MSDKSKIQWCDATLNPAYGCTPVSPACDNCYAARMARRLGKLTEGTHKDGKWTGKINLSPERIEQAYSWKRPRRIFVGSMTDIFHENIPVAFLDRVFAIMAQTTWHTFMLLTKRPERMRDYLLGLKNDPEQAWRFEQQTQCQPNPLHRVALGIRRGHPFPNVWLGVTVEDQQRADERIPILLETPAAKRSVSIEPMLGEINLGLVRAPKDSDYAGWDETAPIDYVITRRSSLLHWVICGGESGPNARPMHPDWARGLRDQCAAAGVPFFFKQWGEWLPCSAISDEEEAPDAPYGFIDDDGVFDPGQDGAFCCRSGVKSEQTFRVGKHRAGRLLDGSEHNEFPEVQS